MSSFKHCPNCGGLLRAPDLKAGHAVRCTKCGYTFIVSEHLTGTHSRYDSEREERQRRRDREKTGGAPAAKRRWVVPIVVLGGGLMVVVGGILLSGCWR
jgi:DNA-directed RNA polymerase subunit M/transcription elongation factor TFIIS